MKRQSDRSRLMARCASRTTWLPAVCAVMWLASPSIAMAQFAGGAGTVADPYLVESAEHLGAMRDHLSAHFRLVADIDLGSPTYSEGPGWEPIGESAAGSRFTGSLDGAGRTIFHLTIDRPSSSYQGLFGYLEGAAVKNLRLENLFVQGASYTGALAGHLSGSVIEEVYVSGRITGGSFTGGIAGRVDGSAMRRLSAHADVTGGQYTGGLVGHANLASTTIHHSLAEGSVTGTSEVGGLVGYLLFATLMDSYSRATVDGGANSIVGGLVGRAYGANGSYAQIHRTYSSGLVVGGTGAGGLLGSAGVYGYVSSTFSYWDVETSGRISSARGIGKSTAEMKQRETYETFDFSANWSIDVGIDYPVLQDLSSYQKPAVVSLDQLIGAGSPENPYLITTADELNAMRHALDAHYRLGNDIDLSATVVWDGGRGWMPVGTSTTRFTGSLDGAGHAVRSMTINRPISQLQGLFGHLDGATVKDLRLEHVSIRGASYTGALVGYASGGVIEAVHISGQITGDAFTGGVAGQVDGSKLQAVSTDADIWGGQYTGGLVGHANLASTSIYHSSAAGSVTGTSDVGGLVGYLYSATLADSYSRAAVDGGTSSIVGGLVGRAYGISSSHAQIHRTYSSGEVSGGTSAGGLLGNAGAYGYVTSTYSYWDVETSGRISSARGIGKSTAEMLAEATFLTWDFVILWNIIEGESYPFHQQTNSAVSISPVRRHHRNEESSGHSITVIASSGWLASPSAPWITIFGGSGTGDGSVTYDLAANPSPEARIGIITVTDTSGTELTYTVHQEALLSISPDNLAHDSTASGGHSIVVSGNVSWTATASDNWITITGGGLGLDAGVVVYRVDENESTSPRTGTIMVVGGGITRTASIRQAGSLPYLLVWPGQREHEAAASAGHEILIYANTSWAASTVDEWIVLTGASAGSGDGVVLYDVDDNLSGAARAGHITITGGGSTYHFRVSQETSLTISASTSPPGSGTIGGTGVYLPGQTVTLTAHGSTGYGFVGWLEGAQLVSTEAVYEFAATQDRSLVGVFELNEYAITYAAGLGGTIDGETAQTVLHGGDAAPVTAVPSDGNHFLGWSDGVLSAIRQDTNVGGDIFVTAIFAINEYLIQVSASPETGGTVSGGSLYEHGDTVTVVVIPMAGYSFLGWTEGQSTVSLDTTYSFQAFGDRALVAELELDHHMVTAVAAPAEAGFVSPESQEVPHGESVELMVTTSDGYGIESVTGCAGVFNPAESRYLTGPVTGPCTVEAAFVRLGVALRASQSVSPAGESVEVTVQVEKPNGEAFEAQAAVCVLALHRHGASVDLLAQQLIDAESSPDGSLCGLTSESGTAVFILTAGAVGEVDVSVSAGALGSDSVVVSFVAAEPHRLVLTVLDEVVAACHESEVEIRLLDEYGNTIVGPDALATEVVVFGRAESGSPVISGSTLVDLVWLTDDTVKGMMPPDGPATVVVTFDAAGLVEVEASSSMLASEQAEPAEITFELGPADDERSELMAAGSQVYAGAGLVEVTVVPRDACGLSLGSDGAVALHATFGHVSQPIDLGDGTYVSAFQTDPGDCPAEPAVITATVNGVSLLGVAEILSICGELDELSPVWLETTHGGVDACAAHGEYDIVYVAPRNESGTAMPPGQDVRILESPPWIVAGESREETDPDTGNSYYALEVGSNRCSKDGPTDVIVTVGGVPLATAAELAFGCPLVGTGGVTFAADPSVLEADGVSEAVVQLTIVDRCGNAAFGREVSLSILGEVEATLSSESVVTIDDIDSPSDGTAVVRVSSASPGLVGLTATIEQIRHDSAHDLIGFEPVSDSTVDTDTSCGCASGGDAAGGAALLVLLTMALGPARRRRGIRNHNIGA